MDAATIFGRILLPALSRLPDPVLRRITARVPDGVDGQALDPDIRLLVALAQLTGAVDYAGKTPARARRELEAGTRTLAGRPRRMLRIEDRVARGTAASLPLRIYVPRDLPQPAPLLLYFHGGGWVVGSIQSHDAQCRLLADVGRCVVVSVAYRLAPKHPFPAAIDDALDAWRWTLSNVEFLGVDPARLAVGGDSAGGNLAAVLCQQARTLGLQMPRFQLLVYPATDLRRCTRSYRLFRSGYLLEDATMSWFIDHYLQGASPVTDPRASPLLAPDFTGLPRAHVVTAGFDPLRDEGRAYAARLRDAGVEVGDVCYPGLVHGFAGMAARVPAASAAVLETARALRDALR